MSISEKAPKPGPSPKAPMHEKTIIAIDTREGITVGRITCPAIGEREAPIIQRDAVGAASGTGHRLVLDFTHVAMMGSLALGMLVTITKECKQKGGVVVLFGLNENLADVLRMSRLDKLLVIAKDEDVAMRKAR